MAPDYRGRPTPARHRKTEEVQVSQRTIDRIAGMMLVAALALAVIASARVVYPPPAEVSTECLWVDGPPEVGEGPD